MRFTTHTMKLTMTIHTVDTTKGFQILDFKFQIAASGHFNLLS